MYTRLDKCGLLAFKEYNHPMVAARKKKNLRNELVKAAKKRISDGGIKALSLRKIAQDAGVTTMATYHYFANKNELLVQIAIDGFDELAEAMRKASDVSASSQQVLEGIMRAYFDFALDKPDIYQLMFGSEIEGKRQIPEYEEAAAHSFYIMVEGIRPLLDEKGHEVDVDAVGVSFWGTLHGLVCLASDQTILCKSITGEESLEDLINRAARGLFHIH